MEVILAKTAGFCFGVNRAIHMAEKAACECKNCVTFGPIIHNRNVMHRLAESGVHEINSVEEVKPGDTVIFAGKGHETGQYVAGKCFAYNERAAIRHLITVLEETRPSLPK